MKKRNQIQFKYLLVALSFFALSAAAVMWALITHQPESTMNILLVLLAMSLCACLAILVFNFAVLDNENNWL